MARAPLVSVVMAAWGRPSVLRHAVESARRQTLRDIEIVVVGDACDDGTGAMLAALGDPRIRFIDLARNFGEQAGPNNVGVARSRGHFLAFLNQDDVWFPDHLQVALDWLEASGADLVFTHTASVPMRSAVELAAGDFRVGLGGRGRDGRYDLAATHAPASSWLLRRAMSDAVGPWRPARRLISESSQNFLFRAWRMGFDLTSCPELTLVVLPSGERPGSYTRDLSYEQEWCIGRMAEPGAFRAQLLARVGQDDAAAAAVTRSWRAAFLRAAGRLGIEPRALDYRLRRGYLRRGRYIDDLRRSRGLGGLASPDPDADTLRRATVRRTCAYVPGTVIDMSSRGRGALHQLAGWSYPEDWGAWTDGSEAILLLDPPDAVRGDMVLRLAAHARLPAGPGAQNVAAAVAVNGIDIATMEIADAEHREWRFAIPEAVAGARRPIEIVFRLPHCRAPRAPGENGDPRRLGLAVSSLCLAPAGAGFAFGVPVDFTAAAPPTTGRSGWGEPESWGTWTIAHEARLVLELQAPCDDALAVTLCLRPFVVAHHPRQRVAAVVDGVTVATVEFDDPRPVRWTLAIPARAGRRHLEIALRLPDARAPRELGGSADERRLGIGVQSLVVRRAPDAPAG